MDTLPADTNEAVDASPTPTWLQYGEVVDIHITGARAKTGMPDGTVLFEVGEKLITLAPTGTVSITRSVPADGEPQPGDLWSDQLGARFAAVNRDGNTRLVEIAPTDRLYWSWQEVHTGPTGPIRLVHRSPEVPF